MVVVVRAVFVIVAVMVDVALVVDRVGDCCRGRGSGREHGRDADGLGRGRRSCW